MKTKLLKACVLALTVALNVEATPVMDLESMNKATIVQDVKANPSTLLEDKSFSKYGKNEDAEIGRLLKVIINADEYTYSANEEEETVDGALLDLAGIFSDEGVWPEDPGEAPDPYEAIRHFEINTDAGEIEQSLEGLSGDAENAIAKVGLYDTVSYLTVLRALAVARGAVDGDPEEDTFIKCFTKGEDNDNSWNFTWLQRFISKGLMSSVTFEDLDSNSAPKDE